MTEKLSCDEAETLLCEASAFNRTEEEALVDSVMAVSMAANKRAFYSVKEEPNMYQFVSELLGDEIQAERLAGREEGRQEGREEGRLKANEETAKRLLKRGRLTHEEIAEDSDLSLEEVERLAEELSSDLQLA